MFIVDALIRGLKASEELYNSCVLIGEGLEDTDKHEVVLCSISRI